MGHHEKLTRIDVREARTAILKSIAEYRKRGSLAAQVAFYFSMLPAGAMSRKHADLFKAHAMEVLPELRVHTVQVGRDTDLMNRLRFTVIVHMYDADPDLVKWEFYQKEDGTLDVERAMVADQRWEMHARYLQDFLPKLAAAAAKFNGHLALLKEDCEVALLPGESFPVHPLSGYFHWYQLHGN